MNKTIKLAGDSFYFKGDHDSLDKHRRSRGKTADTPMVVPSPGEVTVTAINVNNAGDGMEVLVDHDSTWHIYTDSGFESAISDIVGYTVRFSEQGQQQNGRAHLESV